MRLKKDKLGLRLVLLVISCFLIGLGAKMAGSSTLGADVVVLVWEGLNRTFGVDMGTANIIVSLVFLELHLVSTGGILDLEQLWGCSCRASLLICLTLALLRKWILP